MAINKKLIHFLKKENFEKEVANGNILDTSIVFIKDTKEIWTHGQLYDCSSIDLSNYATLEHLPTKISLLENDAHYITSEASLNYTDGVVANLIGSAPETLNTLSALAEAISEHHEVTDALDAAIATKQDKIDDVETIRLGATLGITSILPSDIEKLATKTELSLAQESAKSYTDNAVASLINGAPETLNTLDELAEALLDNADIIDILNNSISNKQDIISDLDTIRVGAALGATSVLPISIFDMETKANSSHLYQLKGDYATKLELTNNLTEAKNYTDTAVADLVNTSSSNIEAINLLSQALQNNSEIVELLQNSVINKANKSIIVNEIIVTNWGAITDITFPYNYKANITIAEVTSLDYAEITFGITDAISGNYAPICETYNGGITIYSKTAGDIIIPTIIIYKNN